MTNSSKEGVLVLESIQGSAPITLEGSLFGRILSGKEILESSHRKDIGRDKGYGEVVFNTSMTGYQEILTDPSYYGQIVCMTNPHIGNTGINEEDIESQRIWCGGFVIHELCDLPSNWRSKNSLSAYLESNGVPGIEGVDTRRLTRLIRDQGAVRAIILPKEEAPNAVELLKELPPFEGRDLIKEVSTKEGYQWSSGTGKHKVVAMDFGAKLNLLRLLEKHDCSVEVVPASTSPEEILKRNPDGVFLSNGPGDPEAAKYAVETVKKLIGQVPIFGVCMGHQILSLALGAKTYKLKFGHHGGNQPVFSNRSQRVEISAQNHGYAVEEGSMPNGVEVSHFNLNDRTIEGISVPEKKAFSVQYHPEASPGPRDSMVLFKEFVQSMTAE